MRLEEKKQPRNLGNACDVDVEIQNNQAVEGMVEEGDDGIGVEGEGVDSRRAPLSTSPEPITTDIVGTTNFFFVVVRVIIRVHRRPLHLRRLLDINTVTRLDFIRVVLVVEPLCKLGCRPRQL